MGGTLKGADVVLRRLVDMPKQIRFATAQAINQTLREVQTTTLNQWLPGQFTLRARGAPWQRPGTKFGFNLKFANRETLTGVLGSQADWLEHQEEGGTKSVAGHRLAIPTVTWKGPSEIMARQKKPRALLGPYNRQTRAVAASVKVRTVARSRRRSQAAAGVAFVADGTGRLRPGIYLRARDGRIKRVFSFVASARIKGGLRFEDRGQAMVEERFSGNFNRALVKAIATAK